MIHTASVVFVCVEPCAIGLYLVTYFALYRKHKERMSSTVVFGIRMLSYAIATPFMTGILVSTVQVCICVSLSCLCSHVYYVY